VAEALVLCKNGHQNQVTFDKKIGKRYQITFDFILATTMLTPAKAFHATALKVFGLNLPLKQNEKKLVNHIEHVTETLTNNELRRQLDKMNEDAMNTQGCPIISSDTQYIRPQKKTPAKFSMTTYLNNATQMIVHHEYVKFVETETVKYEKEVKTYRRTEFVGEARGLAVFKQVLFQLPLIIHNKCGVTSRLISHYFGSSCEAIDFFHRKTKIVKDFRKIAKRNAPSISSEEVQVISQQLITHFVRICTHVAKEERVCEWKNLENLVNMGAVSNGRKVLKLFLNKYLPHMEKLSRVDNAITGFNESLHAHNLRFWSKYIYQPRLNQTKQNCSHLSWNMVPAWPSIIWIEVQSFYKKH